MMKMPADELLPTRWSLLTRLKDWDDQSSWRRFFDTYWQLIYGTALKAGLSHAEAQDVVQEVVISVAKKMGEFRASAEAGSFKAWLLNITRWRITDQLRRRARDAAVRKPLAADRTRTDTVERVVDPAGDALQAAWDSEWQRNLTQAALERVKGLVKPEMFQIFDLLVAKRWPAIKVARRLRVSLAQVYYARLKVGTLVRREAQKLERQGI
jgi:RNA polymerase sigma-70 factor (ECF subfamily)